MATSVGYTYTKLNPICREIRLLSVQPGAWQDELHCNVNIVSLDSAPGYKALSYVWGDERIQSPIYLDGNRFDVTTNLFLALRRFRHATEARVIWADAACINQTDKVEKSAQVAMMGDIYSLCQEAILWLGEDLEITKALPSSTDPPVSVTARRAFELLNMLGQPKHLSELPCFVLREDDVLCSSPKYSEHFEALKRITYIPWWTRIWILQELIRPQRSVFAFASELCPYEVIYAFQANFGQHASTCCNHYWDSLYEDLPIHSLLLDVNASQGILVSAKDQWSKALNLSLQDLRLRFWAFKATDPRDLYYALLGLVKSEADAEVLLPDYTIPNDRAIVKACFHSITQNKDLSPLFGNRWLPSNANLPSWIPDLEVSIIKPIEATRHRRYRSHFQDLFSAWKSPSCVAEVTGHDILKIKSLKVGVIGIIGQIIPWATDEEWLRRSAPLRQWMKMANITQWPTDCPENDSPADQYWRAILNDVIQIRAPQPPFFRRATENDYHYLRDFLLSILHDSPLADMPFEMRYGHFLALMESRMFVTTDGAIGVAPVNCKIDDEVHVLQGANVPFILRRCKAEDKRVNVQSKFKSYLVIGDGYLHGFMDGDAFGSRRISEGKSIYLA